MTGDSARKREGRRLRVAPDAEGTGWVLFEAMDFLTPGPGAVAAWRERPKDGSNLWKPLSLAEGTPGDSFDPVLGAM